MKPQPGNEPGQSIVEYTLILLLVLVIVIIALVLLGPSLGDILANLMSIVAPS